jgi:hypothetical protein
VKPEQAAWTFLRPVLATLGLDPRRVENVVGPGHPDVNYAGGDIELKCMPLWPARPDTPVTVSNFTGEQAGWLAQRWKAQGLSWLMVRVDPSWFLFDGWTALEVYRGLTRQDWHTRAALSFPGGRGNSWNVRPVRSSLSWSAQLGHWLRYDLAAMEPWSRARAERLRCFEGEARCSLEAIAAGLEWTVERVVAAELGGGPSSDVDTLLGYWEA